MDEEKTRADVQNVAVSAFLSAIVAELRRLHPEPRQRRAYSVEEVAEMLAVSPKTIRGCIDRRELETVEVGRHLRIPDSSLARFIKS